MCRCLRGNYPSVPIHTFWKYDSPFHLWQCHSCLVFETQSSMDVCFRHCACIIAVSLTRKLKSYLNGDSILTKSLETNIAFSVALHCSMIPCRQLRLKINTSWTELRCSEWYHVISPKGTQKSHGKATFVKVFPTRKKCKNTGLVRL